MMGQEKVGILYPNWKVVLDDINDLIWEDIMVFYYTFLAKFLICCRIPYKSKWHTKALFPIDVKTY